MRVSFLVLLACLYLSAVSAAKAKKEEKEQRSYVNADGYNVQAEKSIVTTQDTEVKEVKHGDVVEEEEITKVRVSVNGVRKGKRKKERVEKPIKTCDEILAGERANCDAENCATKKCSFSILSESNCAYECKCEEYIEEVVEEVVEEEDGSSGSSATQKVRKVKKAGEKKKKKKVAGGRECAGEKKLSFSNCLIKMKGLVAWGENTIGFNEKFNAL